MIPTIKPHVLGTRTLPNSERMVSCTLQCYRIDIPTSLRRSRLWEGCLNTIPALTHNVACLRRCCLEGHLDARHKGYPIQKIVARKFPFASECSSAFAR